MFCSHCLEQQTAACLVFIVVTVAASDTSCQHNTQFNNGVHNVQRLCSFSWYRTVYHKAGTLLKPMNTLAPPFSCPTTLLLWQLKGAKLVALQGISVLFTVFRS